MRSGLPYRPMNSCDDSRLTVRHIGHMLPKFLENIGRRVEQRPDLIIAAWPTIIGSRLAPMTRVLSFIEGVLTVVVNNSTLYSVLQQHDKPRLIKKMRDQFPGATIKTVVFRLG